MSLTPSYLLLNARRRVPCIAPILNPFLSVQLKAVTLLELKAPKVEQLDAVVELDRLCFGGLWTLDGYQRELDSPSSHFLILESINFAARRDFYQDSCHEAQSSQTGLVGIGCFWSILEEAHITILGIHPQYQGQGLGQLLLYALLRDAHLRYLNWATLEVRASNTPALSLYQKFDFKEAGRRRRYYKETGEDALILWRSGLNQPEFEQSLAKWRIEIGDRLKSADWQLSEPDKNDLNAIPPK